MSQTLSSGSVRIDVIKELIENSKYSIHDLCRNISSEANQLPRFNMPFELGIDIGAQSFGNKSLKQKRILILETNPYEYQKFISDIAGQDIDSHKDDPKTLLTKIRNWLYRINPNSKFVGATYIWNGYKSIFG